MPPGFDFALTVESHGWFDLPPFRYDRAKRLLEFAFVSGTTATAVGVRNTGEALEVVARPARSTSSALRVASSILRLDEDFSGLHAKLAGDDALRWASERKAGRLLRCATAFEDAVKFLCTTNCSWALTRKIVDALVRELGAPASLGLRAFPTPEAIAARSVGYLRERIRCGYRAPFLREFAANVAAGKVDPESWRTWTGDASSLRAAILDLKGFGPYSAENLLKLCGHYEYLGIDSWCRATFSRQKHLRLVPPDSRLRRHYARFGKWKGLAMWLDLTRHWHEPGAAPAWSGKGS